MARFHGGWSAADQRTVVDLLDLRLAADPGLFYVGFADGDLRYSVAEVETLSNRAANGLAAAGVRQGARVATMLENRLEQVLVILACAKLGAIAVPLNTALRGDFLAHQLRDSGSEGLVVQSDLTERLPAAAAGLPDLRWIAVLDREDPEPLPGVGARVMAWGELIAGSNARPAAPVRPADLLALIYTSGTTGASKACMLSHNYAVELGRQIGVIWRLTRDDVLWTPNPLFHFNAIAVNLMGGLLIGFPSWFSRRFSVSRFWATMNQTQATVASLLGSSAILLANAPDDPEEKRNESLRLMAAAPIPPEIARVHRERFGLETFAGGYGMTECSLVSWTPRGTPVKPGSAGVPNTENFEVILLDDDGHEVAVGERGEICVRPRKPHVMFEGYWNRPDATVSQSAGWWFHTGDVGRLDADGYLYFVDRKKDYLRRRGENISTQELEAVFLRHPDVAEACAHAVPSPLGEDDVKLTAILKRGARLTPEELARWCLDKLPYYAVPRYFEFRGELPRNASNRPLKFQLREEGVTPATFDLEKSGIAFERR
jgi:crotonobetaine/carnitine-CoA ligase